MRIDGRKPFELRKVQITPNYTAYAEGSALVEFGNTKVLCTATLEPNVPKWLMGTQKGWVTAEYGMLPRSTHTRVTREKASSSGRTQEISRLIARSLRAVTDLKMLGERSIIVDCDVIQADGGTRTAAITGGFVALAHALQSVRGLLGNQIPLRDYVAAVSVGLSKSGAKLLDLKYEEDSDAETDMNIVMTGSGKFVEVQGTAEGLPFAKNDLDDMIELAAAGCRELFKKQQEAIGQIFQLKL